ncbi:MAG: PAS domain-containing protein, partial [Pseudomonadota bacterium]
MAKGDAVIRAWHLAVAAMVSGALVLMAQGSGLSGWAVAVVVAGTAWALGFALRPAQQTPEPEANNRITRDHFPVGLGRALLHQMPAPLIVISENERLVYVNPAAQAIL